MDNLFLTKQIWNVSEEEGQFWCWKQKKSSAIRATWSKCCGIFNLSSMPAILLGILPGVSIIFKIRVFYKAWFEGFEFFMCVWPYAVFHKMQVVFYNKVRISCISNIYEGWTVFLPNKISNPAKYWNKYIDLMCSFNF